MSLPLKLTAAEIRRAVGDGSAMPVPPVLGFERAAALLNVAPGTMREWLSRGRLDGTFRKRGKHLYFFRDRLLDRFFNGPEWT